jgi:hypothetical protein
MSHTYSDLWLYSVSDFAAGLKNLQFCFQVSATSFKSCSNGHVMRHVVSVMLHCGQSAESGNSNETWAGACGPELRGPPNGMKPQGWIKTVIGKTDGYFGI